MTTVRKLIQDLLSNVKNLDAIIVTPDPNTGERHIPNIDIWVDPNGEVHIELD